MTNLVLFRNVLAQYTDWGSCQNVIHN